MTTEAQIAANRLNARLSTGPGTAEGKAAVSQNRVTLGLFSTRDLVLPEEREEYEDLRAALEVELRPASSLEHTLAMEILHASWRLRRCSVVEASLVEAAILSGLDPMRDGAALPTQSAVDRARAHARNNLRRATEDLSRLQTERCLLAELHPESETHGLISQQNRTKTLAQDTRRQLNERKLAGHAKFESVLRIAARESANIEDLARLTVFGRFPEQGTADQDIPEPGSREKNTPITIQTQFQTPNDRPLQ